MKNTTRRISSAITLLSTFSLVLTLGLPRSLEAQVGQPAAIFHTSDQCIACHNQLTSPAGKDVSIGFNWSSSMMGNSARDPYWMASVRRETLDHPMAVDALEDKCTVCHLPIARTANVAAGGQGRAFRNFPPSGAGPNAAVAQDGVSCAVCHQIKDENLGTEEGFTGGYVIDLTTLMGQREALGPFQVDDGRTRLMHSASQFTPKEAPHIQSPEFCANCHTLYTHALDAEGNEVSELPEQVPYLEWQHSSYPGEKTCQDCHMPVVEGEVSVTGVLANPREDVNQHIFRGGNFLMPRILNKHRADLNVQALPQDLEATARSVETHLATVTAELTLAGEMDGDGVLAVDVLVENLAGHKLPTAYPSRRAWLHVTVKDRGGDVVFESGAPRPDGSIVGNDNDTDATRYEPHYVEIDGPDQVQIYEPVMVDYAGEVTTGLLWGMKYIKDNRILPLGFDKETAVYDVAVQGEAAEDHDFQGGMDKVRYAVDVGSNPGPFTVEAELWYQPIGFRWARNLAEYETAESARFNRYFDSMSESVSALLARGHVRIEVGQEEAKPTT